MKRYKVTLDLSDVFVTSDKVEEDLFAEITEGAQRFLCDLRLSVFRVESHPDSVQIELLED